MSELTARFETEGVPKRHATGAANSQANLALMPFLGLALQAGLVLAVAILYRVELERGFGIVAPIIFLGFLVHSWLPRRWRLAFFLMLTAIALGILLQSAALWLVAIGMILLGLCHLPVFWLLRVLLLLLVAGVLALFQTGLIQAPWTAAVVPLLGAIFMFRLIFYMYDMKNQQSDATLLQRVAYFFMLPNLCFPLFPVIGYNDFINKYYDDSDEDIYRKGVLWMARGISHLLLYRIIYHYFLPRAETMEGIIGVFIFMALTYALYLRVSGLFHLIVGSLCLFGFNLPPTNNNYFLASSFTDLWRRINIYWKDFMMTTVFYPVFMATRRWGMSSRMVVATGIVFVATWFLHSYQWFWLQGVFPVAGTDIAFWGVLGLALTANSVLEARRGRRRRLAARKWSLPLAVRTSAQTLAVFSVMALLWTLWDSGSFADWWYRLMRIGETSSGEWLLFTLLVVGMIVLGSTGQAMASQGWGLARAEHFLRRRSSLVVPTTSAALLILWFPSVHQRLNQSIESAVLLAQRTKLNSIDAFEQERGYYETLTRTSWLNPSQQEGDFEQDQVVSLLALGAAQATGDIRAWALVPNASTVFKGGVFETNRWGFRDRDYELVPPSGSFRIALVGSSHVMGAGVDNEETFDNVLEDRLNANWQLDNKGDFEILNFSVGGYGLLQTLYVTEKVIPEFQPNVVMYVVHPNEAKRAITRMRRVLNPQVTLGQDYRYLTEIMAKVDVEGRLPEAEFARRMAPYRDDIVRWAFQRKVKAIETADAVPVFVYLPLTDTPFEKGELRSLSQIAHDSGAVNIVIDDVYKGRSVDSLRVAYWDNHPNAEAHGVIAERLYMELRKNFALLEPLSF